MWWAQVIHTLIHGTCEYITLHGKRDFADIVKDLELGRQEGDRRDRVQGGDVTAETKVERCKEGASTSGKGKEIDSYLEPPGEMLTRWYLDFSPLRMLLDLSPPEIQDNKSQLS